MIVSVEDASLALAADYLAEGLIVAVPTDTVYGLAIDPNRPDAVEALFLLKERPPEAALPVLVGSAGQVGQVARPLEGRARELASRYWPGPLTLVVPRAPHFTADLGGGSPGGQTVGVRWPQDRAIGQLCLMAGPLAVTSANLHGLPPATSAAAVASMFCAEPSLVLVLDGGARDGAPSTVVEFRGQACRCLREGAVAWSEILGSDSLDTVAPPSSGKCDTATPG